MDLELAWAAGFFDGEGSVRFRNEKQPNAKRNRTRTYGTFHLSVAQVHKEPLDRFSAAVGGGKVRGPYGPYSTNRQAHYQWAASGKEAVEVFNKIAPLLCSIKRQEGYSAKELHARQQTRPKLGNGQTGKARGPYRTVAEATP